MAVYPCLATESVRKMKPRLCLGELTWVEPAIQSKTSTWSVLNFKKKQLTSVSSKLEPAIWSRNTAQQIPCFDRCQLSKTWMSMVTLVYMGWWTYGRSMMSPLPFVVLLVIILALVAIL